MTTILAPLNSYAAAAEALRGAGYSVSPPIGKSLTHITAHDGCNAITMEHGQVAEFIEKRPSWRPQKDPPFAVFAGWEQPRPRLGQIRVAPYSEYQEGAPGFVIEQFSYWNQPEPCWAMPPWEERGQADLDGVFATREAAEAALREDA